MSNCIFCKIVAGEIPSIKIWEDATVFVFLDIHPLRKGHCLVIPKVHYQDIFDIDQQVLQKIILVAKNIAEKMQKSFGATGVNLINASGLDAEQSVAHFHLHLVPRHKNDGLNMNDWWETKVENLAIADLQDIANKIIAIQ